MSPVPISATVAASRAQAGDGASASAIDAAAAAVKNFMRAPPGRASIVWPPVPSAGQPIRLRAQRRLAQRRDLVADPRGLLEFQIARQPEHLRLELADLLHRLLGREPHDPA